MSLDVYSYFNIGKLVTENGYLGALLCMILLTPKG